MLTFEAGVCECPPYLFALPENMEIHKIEITDDGSPTLIDPTSGDSYHSMRGAVGESEHVFIERGFRYVTGQHGLRPVAAGEASRHGKTFNSAECCCGRPLNILEVGFGTGLNALLTAIDAERAGIAVDYTAVEKHPVDAVITDKLDYGNRPLFRALHSAVWGEPVEITEFFRLQKCRTSLQDFDTVTIFDLVYFDAFAYDTQPEMWSAEVFERIASVMRGGAVLVTYSSKGVVKQNLRSAGFEVFRLPGALGKRHMLRAVKI